MSETPVELELHRRVQSLSRPEPERALELPQQLLLESTLQHQAKPVWIKHQRLLLLLLGLSLLSAVSGMVYYVHHSLHHGSSNNAPPVTPCLSPACQRAAARLSVSADPFTQPCDYFMFTCRSDRLSPESGGRYRGQGIPEHPQNPNEKTEHRGPTDDKSLSRKAALLQYLRDILETNGTSGRSAVRKTKDFYHSCLDTRSIETAGAEPFLELIQKLGGWRVSGEWKKTDFNSTLSLLMRDYATFPFFNLYVGKDPNETSHGIAKRYIQIDQPDLLIPIEWNSKTQKSKAKTETLRPFLALCQRYLALLGSPQSRSMIHVGMFISLSSELAVAASPLHYRLVKGQLHQRMTIKELQRQAPAINWLDCLQATFHPLSLSEDDHVLLHNLPYVVQMSRIINKWLNKRELSSSGPLHTFMVLNLLHTLMPAMDSRFSETAKNFSIALGNSDEQVPRWKYCVLETERGFDSVLTHLLSEKTAHTEAETVIAEVFSAFKSKLHELKWTDRKSFRVVMKKVYSLIPRLWTSGEISDVDQLDLLLSEVTVGTQSYFSNYIQLLSLWQRRRSKLLTTQAEAADILSVTPFLLGNELLFPLGMFIPPLFHQSYPKALNYGALGFLIAKDIFHLLVPDIYSHSETVHDVGECVWANYLNMTEKAGRGGVFSLSAAQQQEVWVQYSALQVALQAYGQSLSHRPSDTSLSGLSHTRLFLTSFSQVNCDADPYHESMPLEPSFLIVMICAKSDLCSTSLQCSIEPPKDLSETC
ncbi:kell blood group glycoprotein [Menidia menidia]